MNRAITACGLLSAFAVSAQTFHPDIPRTWDDREVAAFQVPLAPRDRSPRYLSSKEYYALKVRPIFRTYPVYAPGREPAGYLESLTQKEPEIVFDASKLRTKEDWIRAGELVFEGLPSPNRRLPGRSRYRNFVLPLTALSLTSAISYAGRAWWSWMRTPAQGATRGFWMAARY